MSIFEMHRHIIDEYRKYVQSFLSVADEQIREFIDKEVIEEGRLWPDPLLQLNPSYEPASTIRELVDKRVLHPSCADIFCDAGGKSFPLWKHQQEAIEMALQWNHFVVTSGTGSGKSLTYFIPIFNAALNDNISESRVTAIVVYPMNALVNSQHESLEQLAKKYKERTGLEFPVRFAKYTGQDTNVQRLQIQKNPPHILLTNYVMLELMMIRPEEHNFVDRTTTGLKFLVIDELHTYRGRQGADVSMLVRRLRERCGNPGLLCIGTSATMVAGRETALQERRQVVSEFATTFFGVPFEPENIIEESLSRISPLSELSTKESLAKAIVQPVSESSEELLKNPLTEWIEFTFGLEKGLDGHLRRRTPITLKKGAEKLAENTGVNVGACEEKLRQSFLVGANLNLNNNPLFAFKLHQFISQGRTVYATLESISKRFLTMEGQYYAPSDDTERLLYPLLFCRVCGQDYYGVIKDEEKRKLYPYGVESETMDEGLLINGYLIIPSKEFEMNDESIPPEWKDNNGRTKSDYRKDIPSPLWVSSDGSFSSDERSGIIKAWFQRKPFMLCLNCGEFYTHRDKNDFSKLTGLSSEGRSTATTVLSVSILRNSKVGGIDQAARKILSFTDNRQDASLQSGHFNDFIQVSFLRAAVYASLEKNDQLYFDTISDKVVSSMGLTIKDIASNKDLLSEAPQSKEIWKTFRELIEYRVYEDLQRGWRIVQPNLEQCGLLRISYKRLDELCSKDNYWDGLDPLKEISVIRRKEVVNTILDHFRKKLAIKVNCLEDRFQQELRKRVGQHIYEKWAFDDEFERLRTATRFLLPGKSKRLIEGLSLGETSLIGRFLKRNLSISIPYPDLILKLINVLCSHGFLIKGTERDSQYVQLDASILIWKKGDGTPPPHDPIYSHRVDSEVYEKVQRRANEYFGDFYRQAASALHEFEAREHTAQISYENRELRERCFREGKLACLFCSPTMELGIDISDLQMVHLRNVPPTPANYAQRSGRAGRKGDPALVTTYCAATSGHDQYYFHYRDQMVSGVVRPPRIDLSNEDLVKAHVHSMWLAKVNISLGRSIIDIVESSLDKYPLKENIKAQINLGPSPLKECFDEAKRVLSSFVYDLDRNGWYSDEWLDNVFQSAQQEFDRAFDRWRELYGAAISQLTKAQHDFRYSHNKKEQDEARRRENEANRQRNLLCNIGTTHDESDFYPYRYLASEGFLPGYNFPRLPVRAFIPRGDGEFISRPRFLSITEFGPRNIIYHEGAKYEARRIMSPPGELENRLYIAKICNACGYYQRDNSLDLCENCKNRLDASNSEVVKLLEMSNIRTWRRERITCDEEDRRRWGYDITSHFRFAPSSVGQNRIIESNVHDQANNQVFRLIYAPAATLFRINHGWRNRKDRGFTIDLTTGEWSPPQILKDMEANHDSPKQPEVVRLLVHDTKNMLLIYLDPNQFSQNESLLATLQYALQRGIENVYQIEESELISERIGTGAHRAILLWEASEGGLGVLRQLVEEPDAFAEIASAALERCHFNLDNLEDCKPDCARACYECLLSYSNQRDYARLNRHLIREFLGQLKLCITHIRKSGRDYEDHYRWLLSLTDTRSELERKFIVHLYKTKRILPDDGQTMLSDAKSLPDFFYEPNVCVFCDGSVHDDPSQMEKDRLIRQELKGRGYRVVIIRYDRDFEEQIGQHKDVFGEGRARN